MTEMAAQYAEEDAENARITAARNELDEKLYHVQSAAEEIPQKLKAQREELLGVCNDVATWMDQHEDDMTVKSIKGKIRELDLAVEKCRKA